MAEVDVELRVNGQARRVRIPSRMTLADVLRDRLGLTGTHLGCEHGVCGACTVLVDGRTVRSCIMLGVQAQGRDITTIEGASPGGGLTDLQAAFAAEGALQCGFCTPGFLLAATELLADDPAPTDGEVREALSGNLCRCTGYEGIVRAVLSQARDEPRSTPTWVEEGPAPGSADPAAPPVGPAQARRPTAPAAPAADPGNAPATGPRLRPQWQDAYAAAAAAAAVASVARTARRLRGRR